MYDGKECSIKIVLFRKDFIHLFERVRAHTRVHQWGGGADGEGEEGSFLSRRPGRGAHPRTLGS